MKMNARFFLAGLAFLALVLSGSVHADHADFTGRVVAVFDGDTVDVLAGQEMQRVRLAEIDAPEKGQAFSTQAKQALAAVVFEKTVTVQVSDIDQYGRIVGTIFLKDHNINRMMVAEGWAWVYRQYVKDRSLYDLEAAARAEARGLWADPKPIAPWVWRRQNRSRH